MRKKVIYNFPDTFLFPPKFDERICGGYGGKYKCPLHQSDEDMNEWCSLTCDCDGDKEEDKRRCPFYSGEEEVKACDC